MRRLAASLVLASVLFTLCSCGRTDYAESEISTTESNNIVEETDNFSIDTQNESSYRNCDDALQVMGFTVYEEEYGYTDYGITIKNCTDEIIHTVSVNVLYLDDSGNIVSTSYPQVPFRVQPNQTVSINGLVASGTASSMTVDSYSFLTLTNEYVDGFFTEIPEAISIEEDGKKIFHEADAVSNNAVENDCVLTDGTDAIVISDMTSLGDNGYGYTTFEATITNNTDAEIHDMTLNTIFLDETGNITGGTYPYISVRIQPNQSAVVEGIVESGQYEYFTFDGYSYLTGEEYITGFFSVIPKAVMLSDSNHVTSEEKVTENETETMIETESVAGVAESTFNTMMNLTKADCTVNALGQYVYNGLALTSDDCEWIDNPLNKEGTVEAGAVYRKLALCLDAFAIGNDWSSYAPIILGYTPESRDEFARYVDDLSTFIVDSQAANSIRAKFQTMNSISVTEEDNTYTIVISDLAETAKELNVCDEMMGHILCAFHDGGATVTFEGNTCTIEYKDYWAG